MLRKSKLTKFAENLGVFYLFISLNPFLLWIIWPGFINIPLFGILILTSLILFSFKIYEVNTKRIYLAFTVFLFMIHISTPIFGGAKFDVGKLMSLTGLIFIIFYNSQMQLQIFLKFKKLIVFFCCVSLAVFAITLVNIELPYYKIPAFSVVMLNSFEGSFYKLYGIVVSSTNTVYHFGGLTFARICGPFLEPGHFAIYLGILLLFEKLIFNKLTLVMIISGILTFSPAFFIFLAFILFYDLLFSKNKKNIYVYFFSILLLFILLFSLSSDIRDEVVYLTIGRNFDNIDSSLESVLDQRAGKQTLEVYNKFIHTSDVFVGKGVEYIEQFGVLSDWRGMVFKYGIIGMTLSLCILLLIFNLSKNKKIKIIIFFVVALIFIHRSWMMESTFIYLILILGIFGNNYYSWIEKNKNLEL